MILCGTDLSSASDPAVKVAAALAKKQKLDLLLVTVLGEDEASKRSAAELQLEHEAGELRRSHGISVETQVAQGAPDVQLLQIASSRKVRLLVVGAEGSSGRRHRLGSVPERLCQSATAPVLVARHADCFEAWSRGGSAIRVLLGSGLGDASGTALNFVGAWPDIALTVAHVAWPYGEHLRLGIAPPMPLDHLRPEVHHQLVVDLGRWVGETACKAAPKLSVTPGWGRIDSHLAQLARDTEADLLVIGNHQRNVASRLWQGSTSRSAIHEASCNVLCVPHRSVPASVASRPTVIVVPTDFSLLADRAAPVAYSLLQEGGTLHLLHVVADLNAVDTYSLKQQLKSHIPCDAGSRGLSSQVAVLEGSTPWLAIWQYASRVHADLICMATHSRDAAASLVLGSQAQAILRHSRVPVVLVPPDRER